MNVHISANQTKSVNRNGKVTSAVITCHTTDADPSVCTGEDVLNAVLAAVPAAVGAAPLDNAEIVEYHGSGVYEVEVTYELNRSSGMMQRTVSRDRNEKWYLATSNTVEHILYAQETHGFGSNPPATGNLINWNGKTGAAGSASGANIITATLRENCVLTVTPEKFNTTLRKRILMLTGHTNSVPFHGWAAGEVLFLGASSGAVYLNDEGEELIDVTLKFAIRANRTNLYINGIVFSAKGWEVVWPLGIEHVYASRVYPEANLKLLGVGN